MGMSTLGGVTIMTAITFDTLEYTEQLKAAGVPEDQAKGHAKALALVIKQVDTRTDEYAAKWEERNDKQIRSRLDGLATKQDMDTKLEKMELRMVTKTGAMILASVGMIIGYLRDFPMPVQIIQPLTQDLRQSAPIPAPVPPAPSPVPAH